MAEGYSARRPGWGQAPLVWALVALTFIAAAIFRVPGSSASS